MRLTGFGWPTLAIESIFNDNDFLMRTLGPSILEIPGCHEWCTVDALATVEENNVLSL